MAERDTFLRAIIAAPDDDLPRLIFADWLDEHGDPLGEFIRVQCRMASAHPLKDCPPDVLRTVPGLRRREQALLGAFDSSWLPEPLHVIPLVNRGKPFTFRRGFVEEIACTWEDWCRHADAIRAATPLRKVRLTTWPDERYPGIPDRREATQTWLHVRWPGVEFELPPIPGWNPGGPASRWANYASEYTSTTRDRELERRLRDAVLSTAFQPPDPPARR